MVKKYYQTAALGVAVLICTLAPSTSLAQSNDMRAVMNRLSQMENQLQTLSQSVYRGGGVQTAAPSPSYDGSVSEGGNVAAMLNNRLTQLEEEMRSLNGRVEEQTYTINQLNTQLNMMKEDYEMRFNALEGNSMAPVTPTAPAPTSYNTTLPETPTTQQTGNGFEYTAPTTPQGQTTTGSFSFDNPSTLYDQSFQAIRDQDFPRAEQGFKEFLSRYSNHELAGNAKYWLGETYYVRGALDQAIQTFAEGYQQYPQGNKAPDNLLKLGVTLAQKDRVADACVSLKQLQTGFPNAAPAIKARTDKEIKRLNCE